MKKKFSVEQIVSVLKQAEVGVPIAELIRKVGISEQTFYRWKAKYVGLAVDQVRQMKQLRDENTQHRAVPAHLSSSISQALSSSATVPGTRKLTACWPRDHR